MCWKGVKMGNFIFFYLVSIIKWNVITIFTYSVLLYGGAERAKIMNNS